MSDVDRNESAGRLLGSAKASNQAVRANNDLKLLESVQSNTDLQIAKIRQTLLATTESKKEILMQSARTEKDKSNVNDLAAYEKQTIP